MVEITEITGGGAVIQLEGLHGCCVSLVQGLSTISAQEARRLVFEPAEGQVLFCAQCGETIVYKTGAWRSKRFLSETHQEFSL